MMNMLRSRRGCICCGIGEVALFLGITSLVTWCRCKWRHFVSNRKCKCECHDHEQD